jgi:hypothetical protein
MRAQARLSALLAYLAFGVPVLSVRSSLNAFQAKLRAVSPYLCDGQVYNPTTLPIEDPMDPFLEQRGNATEGYPRVWINGKSEIVIHEDCSFTYSVRPTSIFYKQTKYTRRVFPAYRS